MRWIINVLLCYVVLRDVVCMSWVCFSLPGLTLDAIYGKTPKKPVEEGKASKEWNNTIKIC